MNDVARKKQWACRLSLLMLVVPALFCGLFVSTIVLRVRLPSEWTWLSGIALRLWIATGVAGLLSGIAASHFARWSGNELFLIVIHALSIFGISMLWYAATIPYAG
jgi:hypothetical protein